MYGEVGQGGWPTGRVGHQAGLDDIERYKVSVKQHPLEDQDSINVQTAVVQKIR